MRLQVAASEFTQDLEVLIRTSKDVLAGFLALVEISSAEEHSRKPVSMRSATQSWRSKEPNV